MFGSFIPYHFVAGGLFWSEFETDDNVDFSISCVGEECTYLTRENTTVTVPCGKFKRGPGISFVYYVKDSPQTLVEATTNYLQFLVAWNDTGTRVCCSPNTSSSSNFFQDSTCYQFNVTCKCWYTQRASKLALPFTN